MDRLAIEKRLVVVRKKLGQSSGSLEEELHTWRLLTEEMCEKQAKAGNLPDVVREIAVVLYRISRLKE